MFIQISFHIISISSYFLFTLIGVAIADAASWVEVVGEKKVFRLVYCHYRHQYHLLLILVPSMPVVSCSSLYLSLVQVTVTVTVTTYGSNKKDYYGSCPEYYNNFILKDFEIKSNRKLVLQSISIQLMQNAEL